MKIYHSRTELPVSIFLAGPTPRPLVDRPTPTSWRPEAIELFKEYGFEGSLLVPEDSDGSPRFDYTGQIEWELQALHSATVVMFWIPRTEDMPAYTTNVEFGMFVNRPNVVLGSPYEALKMKYLHGIANLYSLKVQPTLRLTVFETIRKSQRPFQTF